VSVTNCFAVPHAERGDEVAIGKDFNRQMMGLVSVAGVGSGGRGLQQQEGVVGWYGTAMNMVEDEDGGDGVQGKYVTITDTSSLIHEFYAGECDDPIHLVVDTSMSGDGMNMPLRAFRCVPLAVQGMALANVFHEVRCSISSSAAANAASVKGVDNGGEEEYTDGCSAAERIVIDQMIKGVQAQANAGSGDAHDGLVLISGDSCLEKTSIQSLEGAMQKLLDLLEEASDFVDGVVASPDEANLKANEEIGRKLADTVSEMPVMDTSMIGKDEGGAASNFDKMIHNNMQDLLMVSYLSDLTKTQLSVAEKLNATITA